MKTIFNRLRWFTPVLIFGVFLLNTHLFGEYVISRPINGYLQFACTLLWLAVCVICGGAFSDWLKSYNSKNK